MVISQGIPSVEQVKEILKEVYECEKSAMLSTSQKTGGLPVEASPNTDSIETPPKKRRRIFDRLSNIAAKKAQDSVGKDTDFYQEYLDYLNLSVSDEEMNKCPLLFWKSNFGRFPIMSKLARKYLAMPASSGSIERLFSVAGAIKRARRANLNVETIEKLLLLRDDLMRFHFKKTK